MILQRKYKIDKPVKIVFFKNANEYSYFNGREKKDKILHWVRKTTTGIAKSINCDQIESEV